MQKGLPEKMNQRKVCKLSQFHTTTGATGRVGLPSSHGSTLHTIDSETHTREMDDEIIIRGGILTTLQHNPFNCNVMPTTQHEVSSSHAQSFTGEANLENGALTEAYITTTTREGPVSLKSIITLRDIIVKPWALLLLNYKNHGNAAIVKQYYFK